MICPWGRHACSKYDLLVIDSKQYVVLYQLLAAEGCLPKKKQIKKLANEAIYIHWKTNGDRSLGL